MQEQSLFKRTQRMALDRILRNIEIFGDQFPHFGEGSHFSLSENTHWMTSFWTGQLWLAYALTDDAVFREAAEAHLASFQTRLEQNVNLDHDLGFLYTLSARAQWQLTGSQEARELALRAASELANRFRPHGNYIQAWGPVGDTEEGGRLIIDCMMNLPLLFWATCETGNERFAEVAREHAVTTSEFLMRPDGSSYHTFFFDQATGKPIGPRTHQGYADDSLWARGQSWAIYGFALAADWTGEDRFIEMSAKAAARFMAELPADGIPLWDLRLSPDAEHWRDSSASVIAANGMYRLAKFVDQERASQLCADAEKLVTIALWK